MARRQPQPASAPLWPKILLLLVICLLVGGFFAYYPGVQRLIASLKNPATAAKPVPTVALAPPSAAMPTAAATPEAAPTATVTASATPTATPTPAATAPALASKERATYEREIKRLNKLVKAKNQQIDDLRIQIKLLTEGSRTAQ